MSKNQTRIFLWAVPRSISNAFSRAMMNRKKIKVLREPYRRPYFYGPSRVSSRYASEPINHEDTFANAQALCEQAYPDAEEVFIKNMAFHVMHQLEKHVEDVIPNGYTHTFIIRHPIKSIPSLYKVIIDTKIQDHFEPCEVGFKELYQMFELVTKTLGQEAIIVDGDDLVAHPEDVLRQYCTRVGIEFQQSMVDWDENSKNHPEFKERMGWLTHVLNSKTFEESATKPTSSLGMTALPDIVQEAIKESMPYYDKMYALRIRPEMVSM